MKAVIGWVIFVWALGGALGAGAEDYLYYPRDPTEAGGAPRLVVPDPDTKDKLAQAAVPGQSKPGSYTVALYSYARPAALYRVTWRLKLDDNTIPEVVAKVWTHDEQGRAGFKGGSLELKGTDFKAAGQYQEFSYQTEKPEGGFFNVGLIWPGKGRVHVDFVRIVPEKLFTEKEVLGRQGKLELPESWNLAAATPPAVHLAKGLWWNFFGLSEAMAELGGAMVTSSYHNTGQYGGALRGFPGRWQDFVACNLVVLANVDAQAVGPTGRMLLEEYVLNGGALLVCGGPRSLEPGGYRGTALARLLPCELTGNGRGKAEGGLVMQPGAGAKGILPDDLAWAVEPRVFYYHEVTPKPEAMQLVVSGGKPLLLAWQCGKGRVAVFAATVEGEAGADQVAFWEWGDTPRLVAAVCRWLVTGQGAVAAPPGTSEQTKALLTKLLVPAPGDSAAARDDELRLVLSRCHDAAFARALLEAVATYEGTPDRGLVTALARAVYPYVDASFAKSAHELLASGNVGKRALGLQLLGMCRTPEAREVLLKVLDRGAKALEVETAGEDVRMEDLLTAGSNAGMAEDERLKLAAVIALGDLGEAQAVGPLRRVTQTFTGKKPESGNPTEETDLNENLVQQSLAARFRLGDGPAVGLFWDQMLKNYEQIETYTNYLDIMLVDPNDKELAWGRRIATARLPVMRQRQALCLELLRYVPRGVAPDVAAELARRNDPRIIPYAYAALSVIAAKPLPPEIARTFLPAVEKCPVPELRRLALNVVLGAGDAAVTGELAGVLQRLAAQEDADHVIFALRQAGRLPAPGRAAVVAAALKHPDPRVQRLAKATQRLAGPG